MDFIILNNLKASLTIHNNKTRCPGYPDFVVFSLMLSAILLDPVGFHCVSERYYGFSVDHYCEKISVLVDCSTMSRDSIWMAGSREDG